MPNPGQPITETITVNEPPDEVIQTLMRSFPGSGGFLDSYQVTMPSQNMLVITRKFVPQWAIIGAIVGFLLTLVGGALIFLKTTETVTVTAEREGEKTEVNIMGTAPPEIAMRLRSALPQQQSS